MSKQQVGFSANRPTVSRSIVIWEPPEGLSIGQALENFLQKRLEILGGRGQGAWSVDCETIQSVPNLVCEFQRPTEHFGKQRYETDTLIQS